MFTQIFELLARIRAGLTKPNARICVEEYGLLNPGDSLRFLFRWWDEGQVLSLTWILSRADIEQMRSDEEVMIEHIVNVVNRKLLEKEKKQ